MEQGKKQKAAPNNIYTALIGLTFLIVLATAGFVAWKCFTEYNTILNIP